jgi:hypothetical protein
MAKLVGILTCCKDCSCGFHPERQLAPSAFDAITLICKGMNIIKSKHTIRLEIEV